MARIVYLIFSDGGVAGGHKMAIRHVETLRDLGFDAVAYIGGSAAPTWLEHTAPMEPRTPLKADDILVMPDDSTSALVTCRPWVQRKVVFCQNSFGFAADGFDLIETYPPDRFPDLMTVSTSEAEILRRAYPHARIHVVPCFADERRFGPGEKRDAIAYALRKRPLEARAIHGFFPRYHPRHAHIPWRELAQAAEREVAAAFAEATLHLSLGRLESVGMTTLEAMASGCVCAGFTGVGGRLYATPENGFWAPDDDCQAAVEALAAAADLLASGGPGLKRMVDAGRAAAEAWSYARFRPQLEAVWMELAPEARLRDGPLD